MEFLFPIIAHAQATTNPTVKQLVWKISDNILNPLIKLGFVIALLVFMWGIVQYLRDREAGRIWESTMFDEKGKRSQGGADQIVWGLFGLFIMVSAFSIMALLKNIIGSDIVTP